MEVPLLPITLLLPTLATVVVVVAETATLLPTGVILRPESMSSKLFSEALRYVSHLQFYLFWRVLTMLSEHSRTQGPP
jgi:hypothetical protein